jgi:hypothetical protein
MGTARTIDPGSEVCEDGYSGDAHNDPGTLPDCDAVEQSKQLHRPGGRKGAPAETIKTQSQGGRDVPEELTISRSQPGMLKSKPTKTYENKSQPELVESGGEQGNDA